MIVAVVRLVAASDTVPEMGNGGAFSKAEAIDSSAVSYASKGRVDGDGGGDEDDADEKEEYLFAYAKHANRRHFIIIYFQAEEASSGW